MMKLVYYFGRFLQLMALMIMPSAIWIGHFRHSEAGAITIFIGSMFMFFVGWLICAIRSFYES